MSIAIPEQVCCLTFRLKNAKQSPSMSLVAPHFSGFKIRYSFDHIDLAKTETNWALLRSGVLHFQPHEWRSKKWVSSKIAVLTRSEYGLFDY
jgi:hypothetical protein